MNKIQLGALSKHRTKLMGLSALMILICHANAYIDVSKSLVYILSFGNIGVDFFLFLSGMGLWYNLSQKKFDRIRSWYIDRYIKLFVPYLLVMLSVDLLKYNLGSISFHGWFDYLFGLSSLRFYVSHNAAWFVAALIPLYLLTPLLFRLIKKYQWKAAISLIVILWLFLFVPKSFSFEIINKLIDNIQFVTVRSTAFVLGLAMGQSIKDNKQISFWCLVALVIAGIIVIVITSNLVYCYFFFTLPFLVICCKLLEMCNKWLIVTLEFIGKITLESYILNTTFTSLAFYIFSCLGLLQSSNTLKYITVCIFIIPIGYGYHLISDFIINKTKFFCKNK